MEAAIAPQPSPEPVAELGAQRAAAERGKIYQAGVAYGQWIDSLAQESGNPFLQQRVVDRVTWMRLLACAGTLLVVGLATAWFLWFVRRRAGRIESDEQQLAGLLVAHIGSSLLRFRRENRRNGGCSKRMRSCGSCATTIRPPSLW